MPENPPARLGESKHVAPTCSDIRGAKTDVETCSWHGVESKHITLACFDLEGMRQCQDISMAHDA
eukprot:scaffold76014_cov20-Tisochrysis_lutea.AAC.3